ncbi:WbqC family protein [Neobacillus sp.]|uniref:WbqC family protein n=1 Tax=Neobacillus sp. TaxID=2675273 RepID=UPI0028A00EF6|nr:WbqC family protein [Neobacillus sp.]
MIVSIHQPNLFPWLGYFDKMAKSDMFIFLDNVQFTKGGFQNRVKVKGPNGPQWLTVPVKTKGRAFQMTNNVEMNHQNDWKKKHLSTIESLYSGAINFDSLFNRIKELYKEENALLVDFTTKGIQVIQSMLDLKVNTLNASLLNIEGNSSRLLVNLVKEVGGTVYLSGPSGKKYLDETMFKAENIKIEYHEFQEVIYPQKYNDFMPGLTSLDYLFNKEVSNVEYMDI